MTREIKIGQHPGQVLLDLREQKGLPRYWLADRSGYTFSCIYRIELGQSSGQWATMHDLFESLGYEIVLREKL